ncbi:PrgI family protein [Patescibacteria group bacterium]
MRFQVPQFIEIEDKIFGPLTLKQFIYLVGGAGISFTLYTLLPFILAIILIIPIVGLTLGLTFYKVNNKSLVFVIESAFKYFLGEKLFVWKKTDKKIIKKEGGEREEDLSNLYVPRLSDSKLKDLSWSLDIKEKL